MKYRLAATCALVLAVAGCTFAQVSSTPVQLADGSEGYRYSGRANFGYQNAEADRVMAETCAAQGKRPLVVEQGQSMIGGSVVLTGNGAAFGSNRQQDIIFRCVK